MTTRKALEILSTNLDYLYGKTLDEMWVEIFGNEPMPSDGKIDGENQIRWSEVKNKLKEEAITHLACKIDGVITR